ncbi:tetratricopeptide (TPR) repeat protein [Lachnospiraceae bacterium PFB1-21]
METGQTSRKISIKMLAFVLALSLLASAIFYSYASGNASSIQKDKKAEQEGEVTITEDAVADLASGYESEKNYDEAVSCYDILIDAGFTQYFKNRAQCNYLLGKHESMLDDCRFFLKNGHEDTDGTVNLMMAARYMQKEEFSEAKAALLEAKKCGYANQAELNTHLVRCSFVLGDYDGVIENASEIVTAEKNQTNAEVCYYRAICYLEQGNVEGAIADLQFVLEASQDETVLTSANDLLVQLTQVEDGTL